MYYKLTIDETVSDNTKERKSLMNTITVKKRTKEEITEYLIERYGRVPNGKHKVYVDAPNGERKVIGFLHSYWNQDISHNSQKWHQTDWICMTEVREKVVLVESEIA